VYATNGLLRVIGIKERSLGCLAALLLLVAGLCHAETHDLSEHSDSVTSGRAGEIRAAFIYNFAKFVEWPQATFATTSSPLQLCAFSGSTGGTPLNLIDGRLAQGRAIKLITITSPVDAEKCQILYLTAAHRAAWFSALPELSLRPVLTISEDVNFIDNGGIVSLFIEQDHVRFRVNLTAAQQNGLKFSARILQLAQDVR
jgi:hypothetical protein